MEDSVKERLREFISYKGLKIRQFCRSIGAASSYVSSMRNGVSQAMAIKIKEVYPELNLDWLLFGKGEMLVQEPKRSYEHGVPYYDVDFMGGFDVLAPDQTSNPEYLIDFPSYNRATCWCNVTGHSMEPEIHHGDIIALQHIEDISFIPMGEIYAIVTTNDMRTIKRIGASAQPGCYRLIPSNKNGDYDEQDIPIDRIRHMFLVLGTLHRL